MSRKRKADQELSAAALKRKGVDAANPKSARSALAACQTQAEVLVDSSSDPLPIQKTVVISGGVGLTSSPLVKGQKAQNAVISYDESSDESSSQEEDEDEDEHLEKTDESNVQLKTVMVREAQLPRTWRRSREMIVGEILSHSPSSSRILITGSSNSGKTAFSEYLMMTLLSPPPELDLTPTKAVAILHLDSSRVTNGLVGHVTLQVVERAREIAPHDFTSSIRQERNVPVGLFGQKENSRHFLAAIGELLRDFQQLSITMPMIVCCPSVERESEQGIDTRTLQKLTSLIEADHICFLHHGAQYTTDVINMLLQTKRTDATVWGLETLLNSRLPPTVSAGARRSRALQSYFHGGLASSNTLPLSSHRPYVISYDQGTTDHAPDVAGCFVFGDLPSNHPFMLSRILNGSMVAITNCKRRSSSEISIGEGDRIPYFASHDPSMLLQAGSIGFGLIRSIDHERGIMFIITPDDVAKQLEHVPAEDIILVHGVTDGAGWAYQEDLNGSLEPCYLSRARKGMQTVKSRRFKKKG